MNSKRKKTLADIRADKGRSIRDLAEHLDMDRGFIARLEQGYYLEHELSHTDLSRVYRFYGPALYRYLSAGNIQKTMGNQ
jgi:transcriptional regulator with XRE-family HTH domain